MMKKLTASCVTLGSVLMLLTSSSFAEPAPNKAMPAKTAAEALAQYQQAEKIGQAQLVKFDTLDFDVYSHQKWDRLSESHADNIVVHYPDGHTTTGIPDHIAELKKQFVFAPDTKIKTHPVRIAAHEWTAVIGEMEGTFTQPMPIGGGKTIPPTGKHFKLKMATIGHWVNGKMDEEYLFWDNLSFMQQIGLSK